MTRACYPGTFNPLTVAHVGVASAAHDQLGVTTVELCISETTLGKDDATLPGPVERCDAIEAATVNLAWLHATTTTSQFLVDIAEGFDWLIVGADKWAQLVDPSWYGGRLERDQMLARLPAVAVAPRSGYPLPTSVPINSLIIRCLDVPARFAEVSSTAVRQGKASWQVC
jgi:nicotinic acid mononucleotide adenylyltransferase